MGVDAPDPAKTFSPQPKLRQVRNNYLLLVANNDVMDYTLAICYQTDLPVYLMG